VFGLATVVLCAALLGTQLTPQRNIRTGGSRMFNYGGPAFLLQHRARPGDGVMYFNTFYRKLELGYPYELRNVSDFTLNRTPEQVGTFNGTNRPFGQVKPLMLAHKRIWVIGRLPSRQLTSRSIRLESQVLLSDFRLVLKHPYKGIIVTLWARR
jgi:hypothetical protein